MFVRNFIATALCDYFRTANLMNGFQLNGRNVDPQKQSVVVELLLMKKTQARLQTKVVSIWYISATFCLSFMQHLVHFVIRIT